MFIKCLIVSLLFINLAHAEETSVSFGLMKYQLIFEEQKAELKGRNLSLSLDRRKCNSYIFDRFKKNVHHNLEIMNINANASKEKIEVIAGAKKSFFDHRSKQGRYFLSLPDQFKKVKIESNLKCNQTPK